MSTAFVHLSWEQSGVTKEVVFPMTETYNHKDLTLSPSFIALERGQLYTLQLTPHVPCILTRLSIHFRPEVCNEDRMMVNGYQTWTQSREFGSTDQVSPLRRLVTPLLGPYGDYTFKKNAVTRGHFHSWTYTYFRRTDHPLFMIGSVDESFAYTILEYDFQENLLVVEKEVDSLEVNHGVIPFRLYIGEGDEQALWDEYTSMMPHHRQPLKKCTGWTSWYYYYTKITQEIILDNVKALAKTKAPLDVFQIDDGYQQAIGDWLLVNTKFPAGMKPIADEIKVAGYRPGLWLAPFICDAKSELYQKHPDWLLRDSKGKPVKAGWNPGWSGWFYALDLYAPGLQDYLREVFQTILDEWGYQMVKLDFLYAVALLPRRDKTRGQIMCDAMEFIRNVVGERWILGCGVPLGPAFGRVDYCRIGSDVAPYWEDAKLSFVHYQERVSTWNSLLSTLGRWQLNDRVFYNDPDVFILRDQGNKLSREQRYTLFLLNNLLGGLVFFSDHVGEYSQEQTGWFQSMFPTMTPDVRNVHVDDLTYQINFTIGRKEYLVYANLSEKPYQFTTGQACFSSERGYIPPDTEVELKPYESISLYQVKAAKKEPYILGTTGHLFPASTITTFTVQGDNVEVALLEGTSPETKVYIGVPPNLTYIKVNGKQHSAKLNNVGARYISISKANL